MAARPWVASRSFPGEKGVPVKLRGILVGIALAATSLVAGALTLDRIFPPDLSRYNDRSTEIVDASGRLLRAFTTTDGKWRLKTTIEDVDPVYLALLKAYEDRRFDEHWGVDPLAAARAAEQWITRGRIVSGASTISMQAARLLEPRPRGLLTKAIQSARALQLEWRYSKREVLAIYLYREMFKYHQFGMASATGLFMLVMSLLIALPYLRRMYRDVLRGA